MAKIFNIFVLILLEIAMTLCDQETLGEAIDRNEESGSKVLSRRKRFLIFPDGSSFQLVFCTQTHGYLQVGDIVWFGSTAALAWELPTDPKIFNFLKKYDKLHTAENRDGSSKMIYYLDENGKVLSKVPYKKRPIVNPAFAKRSVDDNLNESEEIKTISIKELHEKRNNMSIFDTLTIDEIEFHREGRKQLYRQLETFIQALGWSGRECVLRLLCETGQSSINQSTFLGEIMRATFTLPQGREFGDDNHKEYDIAHKVKNEDCLKLYPKCKKYHH